MGGGGNVCSVCYDCVFSSILGFCGVFVCFCCGLWDLSSLTGGRTRP